MAPRANWKGYLKLSLVSCAVELYPAATSKERVSFHLLNRETNNRLRRQMVDPETGDVVESSDQVKGFEIAKRQYVTIDESEIEKVQIESNHTIDIESFVPRTEIDEVYLDTPYYLAPEGKVAEEAFAVIREAMRAKKVVGLGRVVLYRRERILMLEPRGKGLVARTLRYAYEVRDDEEIFDDIADVEVGGEMLDLATHIIEKKLSSFDPTQFEDRYQNALLDLIKAKTGERPAPKLETAKQPSNVINLMDALRRSVEPPAAGRGAGSKGREGQGAGAKRAAKSAATSSTVRSKPDKDEASEDRSKAKAPKPAAKKSTGKLKKAS
jgi:DNA end-binding protein Ku